MEPKSSNEELMLLYLKSIDEKLSDNKQEKPSTVKWFAETFLVPISIALLSVFVTMSSNKISETQAISSNNLAKAQADNSVKQAETQQRISYLEIFMDEIGDATKPSRQINAIQLLYQMEPKLGKILADAVQRNSENNFDVRFAAAHINALRSSSQVKAKLRGFKIVVYYPEKNAARKKEAAALKDILDSIGVKNTELKGEGPAFYKAVIGPKGYEIRFDEGIEDEQAIALADLLAFVTPENKFKRQPAVPNISKGAITIFLPND
jgi:hypothetical protein